MQILEKSTELKYKITKLFDLNLVLFEETVLVSNDIKYCICFIPKLKIYDVFIENFKNNSIKFCSFTKLSPSTLRYFNLINGESYLDNFGNKFKCISHTIEYE
ncbi:hypothetical protein [uncultured Methanobrevibacter sp.]|uniref:hypothetical protein n=1 Tax=uncultured Methanobrevibacter sp. TaxID=253161 RepID=UPI00261DA883|nr:hypothetical protein [uncultured Methanobrevibacter sp.]